MKTIWKIAVILVIALFLIGCAKKAPTTPPQTSQEDLTQSESIQDVDKDIEDVSSSDELSVDELDSLLSDLE